MQLLGKKVTEFDESFIQMLIDNKVPESTTLDYKLRFDITGDINRLELLRDISSFHNTEGGVLILGLNEVKEDKIKKGFPELPGTNQLSFTDFEQVKSQISNAVLTGTNPKITGLSYSRLLDLDNRKVFAIGIPVNNSLPSMVTYNTTNGFFKRNNTDKYMPDTMELYRSFLRQNSIQSEIKAYLATRDSQFPPDYINDLTKAPLAIVRIIQANFREQISLPQISTTTYFDDCKKLFPTHPTGEREQHGYTFDGLMLIQRQKDLFETKTMQQGYILFLRDGNIERVNNTMIHANQSIDSGWLYVDQLAKYTKATVEGAFKYYNMLELNPQFFLSLKITSLFTKTDFINSSPVIGPFRRANLDLPVVFCADKETASHNLGLLFDIIWQSAGKRECPEEFKKLHLTFL